jgi:membrane fusion protein (multidrug efflux system)
MFILILALVTINSYAGRLNITGTVVSDNQKMIGSRYMGYIKKVNFNIGDYVKRDDILFELQSAEFDILKTQADLGLEQAQIFVDMYQTHLDNIERERRYAKKYSDNDLESMEIAAENTKAMLKSAQQVVKQATIKVKQFTSIYNYLEVKAPSSGVVVQKNVRVGDMIMPGMLGMIIVDLEQLRIEADISEAQFRYVKKGQKVDIEIPSLDFYTNGVISSIVPSANPLTHTMKIRINFNKMGKNIFPGMYSRIYIEHDR